MYEKFNGDLVLQTPILDVLQYFCVNGHPEIDTRIYKRSSRDLFLRSPLRDEKTASFSIMVDTNCWKDFGSGEGGGVLDLVEKLGGLPRNEAFKLLAKIADVPSVQEHTTAVREWKPRKTSGAIEIISNLACFTDRPLIDYAASRGISKELLDRYCYQISFHSSNNPNSYHTNIGFPNIGGGYAYRGPGSRDKGCTTSQITVISTEGKFDLIPSSDTVTMFEGFFDFLSYMQLNHDRALAGDVPQGVDPGKWMRYEPTCDIVVLNSVNNVGCSFDYLQHHSVVNCCFDNDNAGRQCLENVRQAFPQSRVFDRSYVYAAFSDFNEYFMSLKDVARRQVNSKQLK